MCSWSSSSASVPLAARPLSGSILRSVSPQGVVGVGGLEPGQSGRGRCQSRAHLLSIHTGKLAALGQSTGPAGFGWFHGFLLPQLYHCACWNQCLHPHQDADTELCAYFVTASAYSHNTDLSDPSKSFVFQTRISSNSVQDISTSKNGNENDPKIIELE